MKLKKLSEAEKILRGEITTFEYSNNPDQPFGMITFDAALKAVKEALKRKAIITTLLLAITLMSTAQSDFAISISQDARLAITGDDNGNDAFTPNVIIRVDLQDNQRRLGYYIVGLEYEYADLNESLYQKYSLNLGYTFNQFLILGNDKLEATAFLNYGMTIRGVTQIDKKVHKAFLGFASSFSLAYPITDRFKVQLTGQLSHRVDKNTLYGSDANYTVDALKIDFSGFIGFQYQIPMTKKRF